ncbi:MAG: glycoside hydrolase family 3 N-terminal domain-containing protein [Janthinobacterium lividum]
MTMKRFAEQAVFWLVGVAMALATALVGDSLVFPFRGRVAAAIVGVALLLAILRRKRLSSTVLVVLAAGAIWQWGSPALDRHSVWGDLADARVAGRHFVVGYTDVAEVRDLSRAGLIGGVFLTRRNVQGRGAADVAAEIQGLQADRRNSGLPPLIVAGDQEGGVVTHLSPPLPPVPALSLLAALAPEERRTVALREGEAAGRALASLGVTMDLAPVVDLKPTSGRSVFDVHTRIATRAISDDPDAVSEIGSAFSAGLLGAGVTPTAKHFPGLGSVATDTHLFGATVDKPRASLDASEWRPFRAMLSVPGTAVMLSHVSVEAVDPGVPASRSRRVVDGMLRREWGFDGIAITDDLTMGAVVHSGLCRAVEDGLNAGVDLLLVSWDTDRIYPALRCAADAARGDRLDAATLAASARRLDGARFDPASGLAHEQGSGISTP